MKVNAILLLLALTSTAVQLYSAPACQASSAMDFKDCLDNSETEIKIMADFSVDLSGYSLAGVTVNVGSRMLTITGNPTVSSTTVFNTSGAAGSLTIITNTGVYLFKENTVHGGVDIDFLNSALDPPYNAANLYDAVLQSMILPVTLAHFSASLNNNGVVLEWATSSELNNDKFIVETSTDGELFVRITEIRGAGTTTEARNYQFTHRTPSAGNNYYRLKQVDVDGTFAYSKVLAITAPGNSAVLAFPNPVKATLYLQYDHSQGPGNLCLFDGLGRRINASIAGTAGNYEINLPVNLPLGTYWLRLERAGVVQTLLVLKE